jgi:hypothetical protein
MEHLNKKILTPNVELKRSSESEKAAYIEETLKEAGVRSAADIQVTKDASTQKLGFKLSPEAHVRFQRGLKQSNIALSTGGDPLLSGTALITGVMEEVTPLLQNDLMREMFPEAEYAAQTLLLDMFENIVGMSFDNPMDSPVPIIKKRGLRTESFTPKSVHEAIEVSQQEMLFLRDPGNPNISLRGIATYLAMWSQQLGHRQEVRKIDDIYTALFNGELNWLNQAVSYSIPSGNRINASALSGVWGSFTGTGISPNASANPILDLSIILNSILIQYRGLKIKLVMNPKTHQLLVQNPNVINRTAYVYANNSLVSKADKGGVTIATALEYFLGGDLNVDVLIDNSVYIPDADDPHGRTPGQSTYLLPDGQIWIYIDTDGFGAPLGEYAYTLAAQNGGMNNPKSGKFMYFIDTTLSQTFEGIAQPRIYIGGGWNGAPRIMRNKDIWTFNTIA